MTNLSGTNLNNGAAVGPQGEGMESPSNFPTYPVYKESGVEWQGAVPAEWPRSALKYLADYQNGYPFKPEDWGEEGLPIIRISQLTGDTAPNYYSGELDSRIKVGDGDLLFSWSATIDSFIWAGGAAWLNQHIFKVSPTAEADQKFLFYLIKLVAPKLAEFDAHGSTMRHIKKESLSERLHVPTLVEQTQIARFLDHETARIDALIEEQQRLIELLKEKRRGIALSALSDQNLPLVRLDHAVDVVSRPVKQREGETYSAIGIFNRDRGLFHKDPREMQDMGDSDFFWIKSGDLIISGQFAWEGAVALAGDGEEGMVVSHRYPVLRGKNGIAETEFIYAILTTKHGDFLLNESSRGAAGRNRPLNLAALLKEKIRIPAKEIQQRVCALVRNETKVLAECREQIGFLQERRSALISAAVTGKIDVRGWQPPASTQVPELAVAEAD